MILAVVFLLAISVGLFFVLRHKSLKKRLAWSLLFFVMSAGGFIALLIINGDPPPKGAIPITKEVLEKEGMTEKEWNKYHQKQQQ